MVLDWSIARKDILDLSTSRVQGHLSEISEVFLGFAAQHLPEAVRSQLVRILVDGFGHQVEGLPDIGREPQLARAWKYLEKIM